MKRIRVFVAMVLTVALLNVGVCAEKIESTELKIDKKPLQITAEMDKVYLTGTWSGSSGRVKKQGAILTVQSGYEGFIYLDAVTIDLSAEDTVCAVQVEKNAKPVFVLKGKVALKSGRDRAGIEVPPGAEVGIWGAGLLKVSGGAYGAAVGGSMGQDCGTIQIGAWGQSEYPGSASRDIPKEGPRIVATGGKGAAGIGGGYKAAGGTVEMYAGLLHPLGGEGAPDIGYGAENPDQQSNGTTVYGGRLAKYDRICWVKGNMRARREVKIIVEGYDPAKHYEQPLRLMEGNGIKAYPGLVPLDTKSRETESGVVYIYVEPSLETLTIYRQGALAYDLFAGKRMSPRDTTTEFKLPEDIPITISTGYLYTEYIF